MGMEDDDILSAVQYETCTLPGVPPDRSDFAAGPKDEWDEQMKEDYESGGPLRQLAEKGLKDYREGRTEPLPGTDSSEGEE
jgi:hypothetical protein